MNMSVFSLPSSGVVVFVLHDDQLKLDWPYELVDTVSNAVDALGSCIPVSSKGFQAMRARGFEVCSEMSGANSCGRMNLEFCTLRFCYSVSAESWLWQDCLLLFICIKA